MTEAVKQAVRDTGASLYRVAKDSGVPYAVLHRFMAGVRDIKGGSLNKLYSYLGLKLTK
jgi:hypothetical protein